MMDVDSALELLKARKMMEQIRIKYIRDIEKIEQLSIGDWIDLRAGEDVFIPLGESAMIPLGVAMQLPEGYEAYVVPRSSTFKHFGITLVNSMGIIDESYCGDNDEWQFPALCQRGDHLQNGRRGAIIQKNERICQFRIMKHQPEIELVEVETLGNADRGGFGSTGKE